MKKRIFNVGTTNNRPVDGLVAGVDFYDTSIKKHIWWDGKRWINQDGVAVDKNSGTFANKPTVTEGLYVGYCYFCTDKSTNEGAINGIPIFYKGGGVWVDSLGRVVE